MWNGNHTAVATGLYAVVYVLALAPLNAPDYQPRQVAVQIFLELPDLRLFRRLCAAHHDGPCRGVLHGATGNLGRVGRLDVGGGGALCGELGGEGFGFVLGGL